MADIFGIIIIASIISYSSDQQIPANHSLVEKALIKKITNLKSSNYLIDKINPKKNSVYVELYSKTWNNPNDTKKTAYSIASLLKQSDVKDDYFILIQHASFHLYKLVKSDTLVIIENYYKRSKNKYMAKKPKKNNEWKIVDRIEIRGQKIFYGLHADTVFKVLTSSDQIKESDIKKDGAGNLIVTHHWKVNNKKIDITFERWSGMYRVKKIKVLEDDSSSKKQAKKNKKAKAKRPESCCIYDDCEKYGGCDNFSNCYGACLDDCMRTGCPLCK